MKRSKRTNAIVFLIILGFLAVWIGLKVAPYADGGLPNILAHSEELSTSGMGITLVPNSLRSVGICLLIYSVAALSYISSWRNYRHGEEHGSAQWADAKKLCRKYEQRPAAQNRILTKNVRIGLNGYKHRRNLNTMVIGGSGAGKSRFYAIPNLMQANTSFVVTDPKGELLRDCGNYLAEAGYDIYVLDLIHMSKSHCYNPFAFLETENDVQQLVTNLFRATGPKNGGQGQDKFWDDTAQMYLKSLIFFLLEKAPSYEQNFATVSTLMNYDMVQDEDMMMGGAPDPSPIQQLMWQLELENPNSLAVKYYKDTHSAAGKTMKTIQITLHSRLDKFNLHEVRQLTCANEIDVDALGEKKTALFCVIPDNDTSFNFLVSMMYTQIFQRLFRLADDKYHGRLPVPVHLLMDEFANIALPDDFEKILSVMRSRNVCVSIILQTISQLKTLYKDSWETITGNCDELLFLGSNEATSTKYLSEKLGKETIDTNTFGRTKGRNDSYSTNYQNSGRELMTADEIGKMDNNYAIVFIRGEDPVYDRKYDPSLHPAASQIVGVDYRGFWEQKKPSKAVAYQYGDVTLSIATISGEEIKTSNRHDSPKAPSASSNDDTDGFTLVDGDEIYEQFKEEKQNEQEH